MVEHFKLGYVCASASWLMLHDLYFKISDLQERIDRRKTILLFSISRFEDIKLKIEVMTFVSEGAVFCSSARDTA